ncbi:hypothetical protein AAZX31_14G102000 [Glycine max]
MRTSFPSAHSLFTRFSKQRRKGRSKCSSPILHNASISRQRSFSLSGSLAPPVISFYDMMLSSPYSICNLVIFASLQVNTSERNGGLHSVTPQSPSK